MNDGAFDGGKLSFEERELRDFYKKLLNFAGKSSAVMGQFQDLQEVNRQARLGYDPDHVYSFVRWSDNQKLIVLTNFSSDVTNSFELNIPANIIHSWNLKDGSYILIEQLSGKSISQLQVVNGEGKASITIHPLESLIYQF
jgi:hypothetical protein